MGPKGKNSNINKKQFKEEKDEESDIEVDKKVTPKKRNSSQSENEIKSKNNKKSKKNDEELLDEIVEEEDIEVNDSSDEELIQREYNEDSSSSDDDEEDGGITLAERLEALTKSIPSHSAASKTTTELKTSKNVSDPNFTSSSLVTLLTQSLQSSDDNLLEQCLLITNPDTISITCQNLPLNYILIFLRKLVNKFEKRQSRGILVSCWISSILSHHYSYLINFNEFTNDFAALKNILVKRSSNLSRLASLKSRLSYVLTQANVEHSNNTNDDDDDRERLHNNKSLIMEPLAVYQDI